MMMKRVRGALAAVLVAGLMPAVASADVLTFDDLAGSDYFTTNYHGFKIGNNDPQSNPWYWTSTSDPTQYNAQSDPKYIATDFRLYDGRTLQPTLPISSTTAFTFNGAYFSGYDTIEYQLSLGGVTVYTSAASASLTSTPIYIASGYNGLVDSVIILGTQGFYAMDNFTYSQPQAVPEPSSTAFIVLSLVAFGIAARKPSVK